MAPVKEIDGVKKQESYFVDWTYQDTYISTY
jgi:hypothetical protein